MNPCLCFRHRDQIGHLLDAAHLSDLASVYLSSDRRGSAPEYQALGLLSSILSLVAATSAAYLLRLLQHLIQHGTASRAGPLESLRT